MSTESNKTNVCSFDLNTQALEAVWLQYQRDGQANCPDTDAELALRLRHGEQADEMQQPEVRVVCQQCGKEAHFSPGEHQSYSWSE